MTTSKKKMISALIVDDDPTIRRIHQMLLSKQGYETSLAFNGQVAVDLFRSGNSFDIVIMDLEMPVMDGRQATKELREMGVKAMIVGVTSCTSENEVQEFVAAGLDKCVDKPLNNAKVATFLQRLHDITS